MLAWRGLPLNELAILIISAAKVEVKKVKNKERKFLLS
jgi:hypothetical protein